jgi:uroporphyrin-III C-methyltransferase/precorrin-2 dehydrogenase/sirohydrochlorin ferrochelatase
MSEEKTPPAGHARPSRTSGARPRKHPIFLDLAGRRVVVVGGGAVAERKVEQLLDTSAPITVIGEQATDRLDAWSREGRIRLERRAYASGDLRGATLAYAATDNPTTNEQIRQDASADGVWLNVVDEPGLCDFFTPALVRQGDLAIAVSTDGASPVLAQRIRQELERRFGPEYVTALEELRALRDECLREGRHPSDERARIDAVVEPLVQASFGEREGKEGRREIGKEGPGSPAARVFLVGGGPGDPELLTIRGRRCLESADVVIYDALVDARLLDLCRPDARRIYVGKRDGKHTRAQEEINEILVREARSGAVVVRLKGGDPFIFGRGGEEAQALAAAQIPYEVVPGVSAGTGVAAYAGIPLTHRDHTSEVVFLTGHRSSRPDVPAVDWARYAPGRSTLVIFMGLHNLGEIVRSLLDHGRDPACPVAVIHSGTTERQTTVVAPLAEIVRRVADANLEAPALIVIGDVVRLRETIGWFTEKAPTLV